MFVASQGLFLGYGGHLISYLVLWSSWQLGKWLCLYWTPIGYWGLRPDSFEVACPWDILPSNSRLHSSNDYYTYGTDLDRFHQCHCAQLRKLQLRNFLVSAYHYNLNLNHNECDDFIFCKFKDRFFFYIMQSYDFIGFISD